MLHESTNMQRKGWREKETFMISSTMPALKGELSTMSKIFWKIIVQCYAPDENGQTSLYAACIGNHTGIVINLLTDGGYDVNHQDNEGKTPLHITFENHAC